MPIWKQLLLGLYYYASAGRRRRTLRDLAARRLAPIVVLTYHRIADDAAGPWTIGRSEFARHMRWLRERFELISLAEAQRRIRSGANVRPAVSVTFDDGYADNWHGGLSALVEAGIPVTYFVSTDAVLQGKPFAHDLAATMAPRPNTIRQLREMAAAGVEIGAHSRTHADLGALADGDQLYDEVVASGAELSAALGQPVRYFAAPFGQHANLSQGLFRLGRDAGYEAVCSAYGGYNFPGDDAFHVQRFCVDGPAVRMRNVVTLDPYKRHRIRRYEYVAGSNRPPVLTPAAH